MAPLRLTKRTLLGGVLALCVAVPALAAAPRQAVHARLVPAAGHGSGAFTASGAGGNTVVVSWKLSVSGLSGPARKASLRTAGSKKIVFALCSPCKAKSQGQLVLLGSVWTRIVSKGGTIVVATRAHPAGELRGPLKRA
jgi:hypothetical protein